MKARLSISRTIPGPVAYSKEDYHIEVEEDLVDEDEAPAFIERIHAALDRAAPWPSSQARRPAPRDDPTVAEPRPSQVQMKRLRKLAGDLEKATGEAVNVKPPGTAKQADAEIASLEDALRALEGS